MSSLEVCFFWGTCASLINDRFAPSACSWAGVFIASSGSAALFSAASRFDLSTSTASVKNVPIAAGR